MDIARALRRRLRDVPLVRAAVVPMLGRRGRGVPPPSGTLFLNYHGVRAGEQAAFERQLRALRDFGDLVGPSDALALLSDPTASGRHICLTFDDGDRGAHDFALPVLLAAQAPAAFFVVPAWIDGGRPGTLGWDECRRLASLGMEVGSHSLTHARLAALTAGEARRELEQSRSRIEAELGRPCRHFACPWGQPGEDYRPDRDPGLARAAGYASFFTTVPGTAAPGSDPWRLPRVRMEPGWGRAELRYACSR